MTPLRASMKSTFQPKNGSIRAVPPMPNAFEISTSTPQTVMLTWLVPSSWETEPRTANDGSTQS